MDVDAPTIGGPFIVGCGASAGGLEALSQLLDAIDPDLRAAFVVVQHLAAEHESMLAPLLQHHTKMPVAEAHDGVQLEAGRVYVAPPGMVVELRDDSLRLRPRPQDTTLSGTIDHFFRSLASHDPDRAIAIVLSGTGSDGSGGIREVRAAGGITMAQEPDTARFDGMPRAAIATGAVDVVLAPSRLAEEVSHIARLPSPVVLEQSKQAGHGRDPQAVHDEELQRVFAMLRGATGVDFRQYKLPTIERRLQRRLVLHKLARLDQYVRLLRENPEEVFALYHDILIHVTSFFREPESFQALAEEFLPRIIDDQTGDVPIRAWVAGCSTGEEAYSLAITLCEALGDRAGQIPIQIFATDVSEDAVQYARSGIYPASIEADVSPERLARFFTKSDGSYRVAKPVRELCVFARQDIAHDPPFSRLDLVLCRNVLIYLGAPLQRRLMGLFQYALKPDRFLMLGHAETAGPHGELFQLADRRHRIYVKKGIASGKTEPLAVRDARYRPPAPRPVAPPRDEFRVQNEMRRLLLDRFAPPGVVVDDEFRIVHFRGQTGAYLTPPTGEPSLDLFKMARAGLVGALRTALSETHSTGRSARQERLRVRQNGGWHMVSVEVLPLHTADKRHYLVLFTPASVASHIGEAPDSAEAAPPPPAEPEQVERVRMLEDEVASSRAYLQSIIQELEAANEELQSANEEILSSNEELQSTNEELDTAKEELQSTNEELNTVNDELHARNEELGLVNSDLVNILGSVQIAILIVSNDLRIRRFTPMAERMLNLIATDVGRPIGHIKPNIDCPDLEQFIREAIDRVTPVERPAQDRQGNWFSMRVRPYKSVDNRIDGAVLSLFDVNELRVQEIELRAMRDYAEGVVQTIRQPLLVLDHDLRVRTANPAFLVGFGLTEREVVGQILLDLAGGSWNVPALRAALEALASGTRSLDRIEFVHEFPRVGHRRVVADARRIEGPAGRPPLILVALDETWSRARGVDHGGA